MWDWTPLYYLLAFYAFLVFLIGAGIGALVF